MIIKIIYFALFFTANSSTDLVLKCKTGLCGRGQLKDFHTILVFFIGNANATLQVRARPSSNAVHVYVREIRAGRGGYIMLSLGVELLMYVPSRIFLLGVLVMGANRN